MTIETLTQFFGWVAVINITLLMISTIGIIALRGMAQKLHSRMFDVDEAFLSKAYFEYLGNFKIMVIVFNIAPYLALRIIA